MKLNIHTTAQFLSDIIEGDSRPAVISVFDDGDARVWQADTHVIDGDDGCLMVYMSDPLYAAYCQVLGIANENERGTVSDD
jgi:hypothetical protein